MWTRKLCNPSSKVVMRLSSDVTHLTCARVHSLILGVFICANTKWPHLFWGTSVPHGLARSLSWSEKRVWLSQLTSSWALVTYNGSKYLEHKAYKVTKYDKISNLWKFELAALTSSCGRQIKSIHMWLQWMSLRDLNMACILRSGIATFQSEGAVSTPPRVHEYFDMNREFLLNHDTSLLRWSSEWVNVSKRIWALLA